MSFGLDSIGRNLAGWASETVDQIAQGAADLADVVTDVGDDALQAGSQALQSAQAWIGERADQIEGIEQRIGSAIDGAVESAEQAVDGFRDGLVNAGEQYGGVVGGTLARNVSNTIGVVEGAGLAIYDMGKGVVQIADGAGKLVSPLQWAARPAENLARLEGVGNAAVAIGDLANPAAWLTRGDANLDTAKALWDGVTEGYQDAAQQGDWAKFAGRGVIDVGSLFIGVGEVNAAIKGAQGGAAAARIAEPLSGIRALDNAGDATRLGRAGDAASGGRLIDDLSPAPRNAPLQTVRFNSIDDLNAAANAAQPNTIYEFGTMRWTTDSEARVVRAEGRVELDPVGRNDPNLQRQIGNEGRETDVGFHLIADRFGGPTNRINVVPGNGKPIGDGLPNLNNGAYKRFENEIADLRTAGHNVDMQITVQYNPGNTSTRPDSLVASYRVDGGDWIDHRFVNK